ncbi:MAG: TIM barrel protein [Terracidiphilus sp.]|jgi:sugar phosphate isomerase/epimerase
MATISRREFVYGSAMSVAAAAMKVEANPLRMPIGCQTYPLRETIGTDFEGTLHKIAAAGFQMIELCSPVTFVKDGYGPLAKLKPTEIRRMIHDAGLGCVSSHFRMSELKDQLDDRIAWAKGVGLKQMICATMPLRHDVPMASWLQACDDLNKIGELTQKAGLQIGYHNHDFEFKEIDGALIYDEMMKRLDPKLVKMQFQVNIPPKYNPVDVVAKYPGRILSLHLSDWTADRKQVAIGQGAIDWKKLFTAAKAGGIKNYFVEMDWDLMAASVPYLRALKV